MHLLVKMWVTFFFYPLGLFLPLLTFLLTTSILLTKYFTEVIDLESNFFSDRITNKYFLIPAMHNGRSRFVTIMLTLSVQNHFLTWNYIIWNLFLLSNQHNSIMIKNKFISTQNYPLLVWCIAAIMGQKDLGSGGCNSLSGGWQNMTGQGQRVPIQ